MIGCKPITDGPNPGHGAQSSTVEAGEFWASTEIFPCRVSPLKVLEGLNAAMLYQVDVRTLRLSPRRRPADPEARYVYGHAQLLQFEALAERVIQQMVPPPRVTRTREVIQLEWMGEEGVIVLLTPERAQVRTPTVIWQGPMQERERTEVRDRLQPGEAVEFPVPQPAGLLSIGACQGVDAKQSTTWDCSESTIYSTNEDSEINYCSHI